MEDGPPSASPFFSGTPQGYALGDPYADCVSSCDSTHLPESNRVNLSLEISPSRLVVFVSDVINTTT